MTATDRAPEISHSSQDTGDSTVNADLAAQQWSGPQAKPNTAPSGLSSLPKLDLVGDAHDLTAKESQLQILGGKAAVAGAKGTAISAPTPADKPASHPAQAPAKKVEPAHDVKPHPGQTPPAANKAAEIPVSSAPPILTLDNFADVAKHVLAPITPNSPTRMSNKELLQGTIEFADFFKGVEAQALVGMYENMDAMDQTISTKNSATDSVITTATLDKFEASVKTRETQISQGDLMNSWANANLPRFSNILGRITKSGLSKALEDPKLSPADRQGLQLIQQHYGDMSSWYEIMGISKDDITAYDKSLHDDQLGTAMTNLKADFAMVAQRAQAPDDSYSLYGKQGALKSINPDAVRQGASGDCYFEAVVASLAQSNPALLRDCIKDDGNGFFTVTFPIAKDNPVKVYMPPQAELALFNGASPYGVWASVLEIAYGRFEQPQTGDPAPNGLLPQEYIGSGGRPFEVMQLFTDKFADIIPIMQGNQADVVGALKAAFTGPAPRAVVAQTLPSSPEDATSGNTKTVDGYPESHCYSIIGFTPDDSGGGNVTVRNPWGDTAKKNGATFTIPVATLMKNFSGLIMQGQKDLPVGS